MRTKGSKNKQPRKPSANNSAERMRVLAASRSLGEEQTTIRCLKHTKDRLFACVPRQKRTRFVSEAIDAKLSAEFAD